MVEVIKCKRCGAAISIRSSKYGTKIPKSIKLKPITSNGFDNRLCAECEGKKK